MRRASRSPVDLVRYIVEGLVDEPDAVSVTEVNEDDELVIVVDVAPEDRGAVIGRQGRTIRALETILRAAAGDGSAPVIEVAGG